MQVVGVPRMSAPPSVVLNAASPNIRRCLYRKAGEAYPFLWIRKPSSTGRVLPLMALAASVKRKATTLATFCGLGTVHTRMWMDKARVAWKHWHMGITFEGNIHTCAEPYPSSCFPCPSRPNR